MVKRTKATRKRAGKAAKRLPQNRQRTGSKTLKSGCSPDVGKKTRFQPGRSGNPGGRPKARPIMDSLQNAIIDNPEMLKQLAVAALRKAKSSHRFFAEVRDTLDGKPIQAVAIANPEGEKLRVQVEVTSARDKLMAFFCGPDDTAGPAPLPGSRSLAEACREAVRTGTPISEAEAALLRDLDLPPTDAARRDP